MLKVLKVITDIVSILFPAIIAIMGVLHLSGAIAITTTVEQCVLIALGALSAIASIVYNQVTKDVEKK